MKIENINQITDELLKQATASSITDFIQDELKKASEAFVAEKSEKDNAIKAAQEKYESLSVESEKVKEELEKLKASLAKLEEEKLAKEKEESFNIRMASLDEEFDLSDEDRKIIADDIKNLTEETFAAYKNKMSVLMKEKNKAAKKAKEDASKKEKEMMASQASTLSATEVVDEALETSKVEKTSIPNSSTATELTLKEKFSNAFGLEGFDIK
jgi:ATP-dependent Clp protease ATP-binding subunit ClpA